MYRGFVPMFQRLVDQVPRAGYLDGPLFLVPWGLISSR